MIKIELMHYFGHIFDRELVCFEQLFTWIYYFLFYGEIIECTMLFDMAWGEGTKNNYDQGVVIKTKLNVNILYWISGFDVHRPCKTEDGSHEKGFDYCLVVGSA